MGVKQITLLGFRDHLLLKLHSEGKDSVIEFDLNTSMAKQFEVENYITNYTICRAMKEKVMA